MNENQIEYVLYHLGFHLKITDELRAYFRFEKPDSDKNRQSPCIVFPLSSGALKDDKVVTIHDIPVLYGIDESSDVFRWENNTLIYNHDFLKSAFYLLSGYQETVSTRRDHFNRFPFKGSFQQKHKAVSKPLVNYYFRFIGEGIMAFCKKHGIPLDGNKIFPDFGFLLSHDVDIIDTYALREVLYRFKILFIRKLSKHSFFYDVGNAITYLVNYLKVFNRPNPHWDFEYLVGEAQRRQFTSTFYFLHKDLKRHDSYYRFDERRMKRLFRDLNEKGCEIGLHGSTRSASDYNVLKKHKEMLEENAETSVSGIRQHRLIHLNQTTTRIQESAGFKYDATLGFAEHEGFRHSFCFPFRLYDFENDRMTHIWHIPLIVMDATLYMYRKTSPDAAFKSVRRLVEECKKFNGVFTLLWHNGNFDDEQYPGGKELFESILDLVKDANGRSMTGIECIDIICRHLGTVNRK